MIVLDASAAADLLVDSGHRGSWVADRLAGETVLGAPHLIETELLSVLRRLVARKELAAPRARAALDGFAELGVVRYPVTELLDRIWSLRGALTPYDGAYVVLAETLEVPLLTTDARLGRSRGHRASIVVYPG